MSRLGRASFPKLPHSAQKCYTFVQSELTACLPCIPDMLLPVHLPKYQIVAVE